MQLQCNYFCEAWASRSVSSLNLLYAHVCFSFLSLSFVNFRVAAVVLILRSLIPSGNTSCSRRNLKRQSYLALCLQLVVQRGHWCFSQYFFTAFAWYCWSLWHHKGLAPMAACSCNEQRRWKTDFSFMLLLFHCLSQSDASEVIRSESLNREMDGKMLVAPNIPAGLTYLRSLFENDCKEERKALNGKCLSFIWSLVKI